MMAIGFAAVTLFIAGLVNNLESGKEEKKLREKKYGAEYSAINEEIYNIKHKIDVFCESENYLNVRAEIPKEFINAKAFDKMEKYITSGNVKNMSEAIMLYKGEQQPVLLEE